MTAKRSDMTSDGKLGATYITQCQANKDKFKHLYPNYIDAMHTALCVLYKFSHYNLRRLGMSQHNLTMLSNSRIKSTTCTNKPMIHILERGDVSWGSMWSPARLVGWLIEHVWLIVYTSFVAQTWLGIIIIVLETGQCLNVWWKHYFVILVGGCTSHNTCTQLI